MMINSREFNSSDSEKGFRKNSVSSLFGNLSAILTGFPEIDLSI